MPKTLVTSLTIFLIVFAGLGVVKIINGFKAGQFIGKDLEKFNTISVNGTGKVESKPDIAVVDISVVSNGLDVSAVQEENTRKMNAINSFLKEQGVKSKDLQTRNYNISPQYDYIESGRRFLGYQINQTLTVKLRDFDIIADVFDKAVSLVLIRFQIYALI